MGKQKDTAFFCKECGNESAKWMGQCPACGAWNSLVEEPKGGRSGSQSRPSLLSVSQRPVKLREVSVTSEDRMDSGLRELNRVLGGGIVQGSLVLVGGDPGIGKSTLLLQMCGHLGKAGRRVLYVSGEESEKQIKMRADRMGEFSPEVELFCETNLDMVLKVLEMAKPQVVIMDSIQTMYREDLASAPGSVGQVRECTNTLMNVAKSTGVTIFLVGHVTKEGVVAGPRVLEHMVDTVLYFEGDRSALYRLLRSVKNRFGSTNEIGVFEMGEKGLDEVDNPSAIMLEGRPIGASGSVVTCSMEGTRPMLLEIQALAGHSSFNMPKRTTVGADYNRTNLLIAILEKRLKMDLSHEDIYVNITGGMKINEPSVDLGILMAIASSYLDLPLGAGTIVFGELGLAGEVRGVGFCAQRIQEAAKMGFTTCVVPKVSLRGVRLPAGVSCIGVENIREAMGWLRAQQA